MPIEVSFKPSFIDWQIYFAFSVFVEVMFLIDIVLMCFTSFMKKGSGVEQKNFFDILSNYLFSTRFIADALAILGNTIFSDYFYSLKFLSVFKILRINRLGIFIKKTNFNE